MDISVDDTLPDEAWKDSFDKLLDQRPEQNIIKKDVRASFNMNSSYENSYANIGSVKLSSEGHCMQKEMRLSTKSAPTNVHFLDVPHSVKLKTGNRSCVKSKAISTPIKSYIPGNPFKCALSPIGPLELIHFNNKREKGDISNGGFNTTPINNAAVNVEYIRGINNVSVQKENSRRYSLGISPLALVRAKWKSKQNQKQVCFVGEELRKTKISENLDINIEQLMSPAYKFDLQPGKWRKTLNCLRRKQNSMRENGAKHEPLEKGRSTGVLDVPKSSATTISVAGNRKSICMRPNSIQTRTGSRSTYSLGSNDFKRQILQRCGQRRILTFDTAYNEDYLQNCCKIGEGAFGEVFVHSKPKDKHSDSKSAEKTVLKIIPIEGKQLINGEVQKTFEQILPEIIISMELSRLNNDVHKRNVTAGFVNLQKVRCVKGQYPSHLQKLWEKYDLEKESENDHPKCFTNNQHYIVLELAYGGQDLEGFHFKNAEQSFSALQQIILTLAVGEKEYQFEHRDLHWGNVLVLNTNDKFITYRLDDDILTVPTKGIKITIIDYTLSRMTYNDYCFYNDLSNEEELFSATGDYQFEIYRMMQKVINNKWETFEPKTNIFWISYIISKLIEGVLYKNARSKNHLHYLDILKQLQTTILAYESCAHCARDVLLY